MTASIRLRHFISKPEMNSLNLQKYLKINSWNLNELNCYEVFLWTPSPEDYSDQCPFLFRCH